MTNGNMISESRTLKGCLSSQGEKEPIENALKKNYVSSYHSENRPNFSSTLASQELELQGSL